MARIGYMKKENANHKDGYEYLEVYTTPTIINRTWWFKREVGWIDSPRFVMVRNRFGWTYLVESNHKDLIIFDEYKLIIDNYWRVKMSKGYSYYYRLECYEGFRNNMMYEDKTFSGLVQKFKHYKYKPKGREVSEFIKMYDTGSTGAYYRIHCVFVYPDGSEKIIYTAEGL